MQRSSSVIIITTLWLLPTAYPNTFCCLGFRGFECFCCVGKRSVSRRIGIQIFCF